MDSIEKFRDYDGPNKSSSRYFVQRYDMPGLFHRRPEPGEPPFVDVGSRVERGKTQVGIVEAMKMMQQVMAEESGIVLAIYVDPDASTEDGTEIEKDQNLMLIDRER